MLLNQSCKFILSEQQLKRETKYTHEQVKLPISHFKVGKSVLII